MALNRSGISDAIANLLKADTTTLYGTTKLIQRIESDPSLYGQSLTNKTNKCALYIWTESVSSDLIRSQNIDKNYSVNLRLEVNLMDIESAYDKLDGAIEQIEWLVNQQMWNGLMLTQYYSDSNAQVYNLEPDLSELPEPRLENDTFVFELSGAINVYVNKYYRS